MSSDAQINANRLNAEKSTGPTSPEGKANSRFNSLKSGLYAKSAVLPGEDAAEREALAESFHQRFQPKTPEQAGLVDELIRGNWILQRLRHSEESLWQLAMESVEEADPGQAYKNYPVLDRVMSRITGVKRAYDSDLRLLVTMLEKHAKAEAAVEKVMKERAHRRLVRELREEVREDGMARYWTRAEAEAAAREIEADELDAQEAAEDAAGEERLAAGEVGQAGALFRSSAMDRPGPFQTASRLPISQDASLAPFGTGPGSLSHQNAKDQERSGACSEGKAEQPGEAEAQASRPALLAGEPGTHPQAVDAISGTSRVRGEDACPTSEGSELGSFRLHKQGAGNEPDPTGSGE